MSTYYVNLYMTSLYTTKINLLPALISNEYMKCLHRCVRNVIIVMNGEVY